MWVNIKTKMPKHNKYVLAFTPFCDYKCAVVFFNGINWISADNQTEVWNVEFWQELPKLPKNK